MMHFYSGSPMHILSGVDTGECEEAFVLIIDRLYAHFKTG